MTLSKPPPIRGRIANGSLRLPEVEIDSYNAEIKDGSGFIGDRASGRAFRAILDDERDRLRQVDADPIGDVDTRTLSKKKMDLLLAEGDLEAAGVLLGALEEFAQEFSRVIRRFLRLRSWQGTQRIAVGGGLRASRIGELAIGRTAVLLKGANYPVDLFPIHHHPDEAGLIGCVHLAPSWIFSGHDAFLAVDLGGSNFRVGLVKPNLRKSADLGKCKVWASELWRHADDEPDRKEAIERLSEMLAGMLKRADKEALRVAPFIGVGCPGVILEDGTIKKGGQNLPGDWEHEAFNLPRLLHERVPSIQGHETMVLMHNDAVVQGLSQIPFMREVARWGVMTIGTGLGNARFSNRKAGED